MEKDELYENMTEPEKDVLDLSMDYGLWESAERVMEKAEERMQAKNYQIDKGGKGYVYGCADFQENAKGCL